MSAPRASRLPRLRQLWWGLAASPVAWVLTELVGYPMVARSCEPGARGVGTSGLTHPRAWMIGLTALLAVVALSGLWTAIASVRATEPADGGSATDLAPSSDREWSASTGRARFMARAGVFVSAIFLGGTVLYALPSLIVNVCAQVR